MRFAAVALTLLLSGCLFGAPDYVDIDRRAEARAMEAIEATLDGDPLQSSFNLDLVGYHNGVDGTMDPATIPAGGRYTELAVTDERAYLAKSSGAGEFGGFSIIDIRDVTDPFLVSSFAALGGSDLEVSSDENLVFFATQRNTIEQMVTSGFEAQDPTASAPRGIYVVDVSNKRSPTLASFMPVPYNGVHTISYAEHPDGDYLIASVYDLHGNTIPSSTAGAANAVFPFGVNPVTQSVIVFKIVTDSGPAYLEPVSRFQVNDPAAPDQIFFPHDTAMSIHPSGQVLLTVAYWDRGIIILDFEDPAAPFEIGRFDGFEPSKFDSVHLAKGFPELLDGRHITVVEPEIPGGDETGQITILDTTNPTNPVQLGYWTQPHPDVTVQSFDNSPHNFDLLDGQIALAHNQLGAWVIDVSTEEHQKEPKTLGYYIPKVGNITGAYWSTFWLERGDEKYVLGSDQATGLHILRYLGP